MKTVKVKAPATLSNLVCGFDIIGLAVDAPFDVMEVSLIDEPIVVIKGENQFNLPTEPALNTAGAALLDIIKSRNNKNGFEVIIHKNIKPGSGIGSSAASAAGAVVAANFLLDNIYTNKELVHFAMAGEQVASGAWHADNIAPCIYGGVTLIRSNDPLDIISISSPQLYITIVHPQIEIKTSEARKILPTNVSLKDAVQGWGNSAALIAGFIKNDINIISRCLHDNIIEPVRKKLIPGFDEVKKRCLARGAIGGGISGSGPSIFMFSSSSDTAQRLAIEMEDVYKNLNIPFLTYVTQISEKGVSKIE